MEKEHFEILLEKLESNFQLAFEGLQVVNERLGRLESGQTSVTERLDRLEAGQAVMTERMDRLEAGQEIIKREVREVKRSMGLLHSIANNHEGRLQRVENDLRDHLSNHS